MKSKKMFQVLAMAVALIFIGAAGVIAASVEPETYPEWQSGDAGYECVVVLGYDFGFKIDGWSASIGGLYSGACDGQGSCTLDPLFNNNITITNNNGTYFDWAAEPFAISAVVVKGGPSANVFSYDPAVNSDSDLYAPINPKNDENYDISHVSFCWNKDNGECFQDETAWVFGDRYVKKRNWATYTAYNNVEQEINIFAGQTIFAGKALFSACDDDQGKVNITITLKNGFIFYYDLNNSNEDDNIKIQGYSSMPPATNPAPGRFEYKAMATVGSTTYTIEVPCSSYYGIHLDVAYPIPCD